MTPPSAFTQFKIVRHLVDPEDIVDEIWASSSRILDTEELTHIGWGALARARG